MVSVCMATYNGERYIREQVESILSELDADDELIISDDRSTDDTIKIINSFNDKRIKVLVHQKDNSLDDIKYNRNFYYTTSNFENALKEAKGDYIFLSDQDDVWVKGRKNKMIDALKNNNADCVLANFTTIDGEGKVIIQKGFEKNPIKKTLIGKIIKSRFVGSSMAFTKELLDRTLPFPHKLRAHDYWIGCFARKPIFLDEELTLFRRHGDNVSQGIDKSSNPLFYKIWYRVKFFNTYIKYKK